MTLHWPITKPSDIVPTNPKPEPAAEELSLATEIRGAYQRIFHPVSTFGAPLSQADQEALVEMAARAGVVTSSQKTWSDATREVIMPGMDRDAALAEASGRWPNFVLMGETEVVAEPDAPNVKVTRAAPGASPLQTPAQYLPGDFVAIRARVARVALRRLFDIVKDASGAGERQPGEDNWAVSMARLLYRAVPYFLPAATAHGIMASVPPDPALAAELRLPYPVVAVFFGSDLEIPPEVIGGEEALDHRRPPDAPSSDTRINLPSVIRPALMALRKRQPLALTGVVLVAGEGGSLSDFVLFIVRTPNSKVYGHSFVEALLSKSRLAPLVLNLAASVAWGGWTPPPDLLELPQAGTKEFRKAINRGSFRRREPRGAAAGVYVLDVSQPAAERRRRQPQQGEHASPTTHLRRGHWRRQRIGARADWHYDVRWVRPTLVNPEGTHREGIRVYRLPIPPADRQLRDSGLVPTQGEDA